MAIVYLDDGRLADEFLIGEAPYILSDALVMRPEDYERLTPEAITAMKQARYDNWFAIVTAPPTEAPADPAV
ncbi:hypothetical protein UFOVP62_6 [uncultured Caudovirales phage]|uniref:Uncharacterized protein n=1 Tax=uncultured Caudovirales phage TaxID=2100421 RepID=A0A6J5KTJ2_9CAUD|nr:hypothetical protein UFOVP62_6 [uncultured Caudovirales phage]